MDPQKLARTNEDLLYKKLDELTDLGLENSPEFMQIDAELTNRANKMLEAASRAKAEKLSLQKEWEHLLEVESRGFVMSGMIEVFGQQYIDFYEIDVNCVLTSTADLEAKEWQFDSLDEAKRHLTKLLYDRVYTDYFRNGPTTENLMKLKTKIKEMKGRKHEDSFQAE